MDLPQPSAKRAKKKTARERARCVAEFIVAAVSFGGNNVNADILRRALTAVCDGDYLSLYACARTCKAWYAACAPAMRNLATEMNVRPWREEQTLLQTAFSVARAISLTEDADEPVCCACFARNKIKKIGSGYYTHILWYLEKSMGACMLLNDREDFVFIPEPDHPHLQYFCYACMNEYVVMFACVKTSNVPFFGLTHSYESPKKMPAEYYERDEASLGMLRCPCFLKTDVQRAIANGDRTEISYLRNRASLRQITLSPAFRWLNNWLDR